MQAVFVTAYTAVTACGLGQAALLDALLKQRSFLKPARLITLDFPTFTGEIESALPEVTSSLKSYDSRNARIALAALDCEGGAFRKAVTEATCRYGAERVGVIIGTSTSGIYETELAYQAYEATGKVPETFDFKHQHAWVATAEFLKKEMGVRGACYAISTACSSSGKAIVAGQRLIEVGICDAVIVGGVDSICHLTLHGFHSLQLTSESPCTPLDRDRNGISLGEGAGLLLLERAYDHNSCASLVGYGESSDAYHMTAPHPEGAGSTQAMCSALTMANLQADSIDYVNLHATGTRLNDQSEMRAMTTVFGSTTACSGSKGMTGHTLGAAGAVEAVITLLALQHGFAPGTCGIRHVDESFSSHVLTENVQMPKIHYVMSNNFGFGGNNVSLIFAGEHAHG
ncbi:MAG: beta-ketoacyl-ACP synthase [Mariprofundaceae bacterium]